MSANAGREQATLDELRARVEREKLELTSKCILATDNFLDFDTLFNRKVLEVFDVVLAAAKSVPPSTAFRSERNNLDELIDALIKKRAEGGFSGGAGGDVVGGAADWIEDLERIVKALSGVVKEEKDFFLQIIKLIFCGC
jgi:hypothetical protein